jgi:hypothetical protein
MVSAHCCCRVLKETLALQNHGHVVDGLAQMASWGQDIFHTYGLYASKDQLKAAIETSPADLIHYHNGPDWPVPVIKEAAGHRPVVYDVHDMDSMLWEDEEPGEKESAAFAAADALVHVSWPAREWAHRMHSLQGKPEVVLHPYTPETLLPKKVETGVTWGAMIYEGGMHDRPWMSRGSEDPRRPSHRFYAPTFARIVEGGWDVHAYSAGVIDLSPYHAIDGVVVHHPLGYRQLLRVMRQYGLAIVGFPQRSKIASAASPNKYWDALAQGCVPVILNCEDLGAFASEQGMGIELDLSLPIGPQIESAPDIRETIELRRWTWTMERHIRPLIRMYEDL